jgi:uncharacterized protein YjbI with pentapeptide repeats
MSNQSGHGCNGYVPPGTTEELLRRYALGERHFHSLRLSDADLSGAVLDRADFTFSKFDGTNLSRCSLEGTTLKSVTFYRADLKGVNLRDADLADTQFIEANLSGADLRRAKVKPGMRAQFVDDQYAYWSGIGGTSFSRANLTSALLEDVTWGRVFFYESVLDGARMRGARLDGSIFVRASLAGVSAENSSLVGADFTKARMPNAILRDTVMTGARLEGARANGTQLTDADLAQANLKAADLAGSNLHGARLRGAQLVEANFAQADLRVRDFEETVLDSTCIAGARLDLRASDTWFVLKRRYGGAMSALHLLFVLAFLLPFFVRGLWWSGVGSAQGALLEASTAVRGRALDRAGDFDRSVAAAVSRINRQCDRARADKRLAVLDCRIDTFEVSDDVDQILRSAPEVSQCLAPTCDRWKLANVLLGVDSLHRWPQTDVPLPPIAGKGGWLAAARYEWQRIWPTVREPLLFGTGLLIILYNLLRARLAYEIALLRDQETSAGFTPPRNDVNRLWTLHVRYIRPMMAIAFVVFLWHGFQWLVLTEVWLPRVWSPPDYALGALPGMNAGRPLEAGVSGRDVGPKDPSPSPFGVTDGPNRAK